jgi:protein O-GlcNAc transferase
MTIPQAFDLALQYHQAGRLAEAEALYRQILAAQPTHADALHLLGLIAHQVGRHDLAVEWIRQAIVLNPNNPFAHSNLGEACRAMGRFDEAMAASRRALEIKPDYPNAHLNLGNALRERGQLDEAMAAYRRALEIKADYPEACYNLGIALRERGQLDEAIAAYRHAIGIQPGYPEAHNNLGVALREAGQLDEAIAAYRRALEMKPDYPEGHYNLGIALRERGQLDEAVAAYRRALGIHPDYPEAHNNLGAALAEQGQLDEAMAAYRRALEIKSDYPEAHYNLGIALRERGQLDGAVAAYRRALGIRPDYPEAHNNLGAALAEQGQLDEAMAAYRHALKLKPAYPQAHNNLGVALRDRGQLDEAAAACRHALELKPSYPEAHNNLGAVLAEQGQLDEAMAAYRHALELKPDDPETHNNLGNALRDRGQLDEAVAEYRRALELKPERAGTHSNLVYMLLFHPGHTARSISEERHRWNRRFSEPLKRFILPHANDRSPKKPLRIGYVSPDFRDHVVGRNLLPLFQCHDRKEFEVFCYAGVVRPDKLTEEFRQHAQQWRGTVGVSDEALAEMIRRDGVDILVDLTQHMAGNRLPLFARKPAPVQVSFAGYPESTGLEAIEYRISDRFLEPGSADEETGRREQVHLIDSFWCYDPCGVEVEVNGLPARESGSVTFGSLNNFCKVNEHLLRVWARVLGTVKASRLVLLAGVGSHRQRTLEALERGGVETQQVEFVQLRPRRDYLELYHRLDIVLDTFPYNGHTTSLDALWMGVPVVSLAGETPVSRAGLSQLSNLGLTELVAHSEEDYVKIAVALAEDLPRLTQLRSTLRARMQASVLMDAPRFTRQVEQAYREIWQAWRRKQSPVGGDL